MSSVHLVSLSALHGDLQQLCIEIRSEQPTTRNKAIDRLDSILCTRKLDVIDCLSNREYAKTLNWSTLFNNGIEGLIKHAIKIEESKHLKNITTLKNKNFVYSAVVNKIVDYAIEAKSPIRLGFLMEAVSNGLENSIVFEQFGTLLFQIIENGFIVVNESLSGVKSPELNNFLSLCFCRYTDEINRQTLSLLRCLNKIIDLGTKYTQLCTDLVQYLPVVRRICNSVENDKKFQQEVIKLSYNFVCNLAVDHHSVVCTFLQSIMPSMCGYYEFRMKPDIKAQLFELCAICLNIHYLEVGNFQTSIHIEDEAGWKKLIKQMFNLVQTEIKEKSRELDKEAADFYCDKFLLLASCVCYLIFWSPIFDGEPGESRKKIVKRSNKYQGLLDRTTAGESTLNWGWFVILSEFIAQYHELIEVSDYQPMLQTVAIFHRVATTSRQMNSISKCCEILLKKDQEYANNAFINADFCSNEWKKIIDIALSNLLQKSLTNVDNQTLVQLLLQHKKLSDDCVIQLIRSLTTNPLWRTDSCLKTIKVSVKFYRNVILASEMIADLILWLYPLIVQVDTKSVINYKPTDPVLKAEIAVMVIVEEDNSEDIKIEHVGIKSSTNCDSIKTALEFKFLKKLIFIESRKQQTSKNTKSSKDVQSKLIVNENYFKILLKSVDFDPRHLSNIAQLDVTDLLSNMSKLESILSLLNTFLKHGTFDTNDLHLSALTKTFRFLLNGIELQLADADIKLLQISYAQDVFAKIESITEKLYRLDDLLFQQENDYTRIISFLVNCLNWFSNEDAMCETDDMIFRRKLSLECIKVLALCRISSDFFTNVDNFEINYECVGEISATLNIIEVFCKHERKTYVAEWIMKNITEISKQYHKNMKISTKLIKLLPPIAEYIKPFSLLTDDINVILTSFSSLCYNKIYPPHFVQEFLLSVKYVAKIYHELINKEDYTNIYLSINKLMLSSSILIQYAAIDCWSYLIDEKWIFEDQAVIPFVHNELSSKLFHKLKLIQLEAERSSGDGETSTHSVCIQLFLSAFGLSFSLQEEALLELTNFYFRHETIKELVAHGLKEIGKFLGCDFELVCKRNIKAIVDVWLKSDMYKDKTPWFLVSQSEQNFFQHNENQLYCCALGHSPQRLKYIASKMECQDIQVGLKRAIPLCTAITLPYFSDNNIDMPLYRNKSKQLIRNLKDCYGNFDLNSSSKNEIWQVLYYITNYLWDEEKFTEFFGFSLSWPKQEISFNYDTYIRGIKYFLVSHFTDQQIILDGLMKNCPVQLVYFLSAIKADFEIAYCIEARLFSFFHYCTIMNLIVGSFSKDFWRNKHNNIREYFIRDSIYYLCNILTKPNEDLIMLQVTSHFLYEFFCSVMPLHSDLVNVHLNTITRALIGVITRELNDQITNMSIDILSILIIENSEILSKSIATLDDFPTHELLKQLRECHEKIKYKNQGHCLLDEINYFLQVDNRGVVGYKNLRKCLASKKDELAALCNDSDKTTEEIHSGAVYKLLKVLLNAIKNQKDVIAEEATKCLGEIGPSNLITIVLFSDLSESCYKQFHSIEESFDYFISVVLKALDHLLVTENHSKVSKANEICHHIINSKSGKRCLDENALLRPFVDSSVCNVGLLVPVVDVEFVEKLNLTEQMPYKSWITAFTSKIYACFRNNNMEELAAIDTRFCEETLTVFFKMLLATGNVIHIRSIERLVNIFFQQTFNALNDSTEVSNCIIYTDKAVIKYFLNIVECIRMHNQISSIKLKTNYLHIAKACVYCEAYFMAVLCLEMWALGEADSNAQDSKPSIANEHFQYIAKEAFTEIGYLDAITGFLDPIKSRLDYLTLGNQWDTVLLELDADYTSENNSINVKYLQRNGFYSLAGSVPCKKVDYETVWRLGDWNILTNDCRPQQTGLKTQEYLEESFQYHHFVALKSINKLEEENTNSAIESAREAVMMILRIVSSECAQNICKYMTWLQMLQQIEDFSEIQFPKSTEANNILEKWNYESQMKYRSFDSKELALSQKITLFNSAGVRAKRKINEFCKEENIVGESVLSLIIECKLAGNKNLTIRNIAKLKNMSISADLRSKVLVEDAEINWKLGNYSLAKSILHHIAGQTEFAFCLKRVDALRIYGEYVAESNSKPFSVVYARFFDPSLKLLANFDERKERIAREHPSSLILKEFEKYNHEHRKNIYKSIAKYADREYTQLSTYINSEDCQTKMRLVEKHQQEAQEIRAKRSDMNRDEVCTFKILIENAGIDHKEIKYAETKRIEYLELAIESYMQCCVLENSIRCTEMFRLISLWFANKHVVEVSKKIKENIERIPSYKFLFVLNQITARLSSDEAEFNALIKDLLIRCSIEHPHHTLPQVLAIANANMDSEGSLQHPRVEVANDIVNVVRSKSKSCSEIVTQMQQMSKALIEFANKDIKTTVALSENMRKLKNLLRCVQCPTLELAVSPSKRYDLISVVQWKDKVTLVGGINVPKKIVCLCYDGIERPQLLKGKDDLRQDAIMQQALCIINDLLLENKETFKRKLSIHTYKVVPLSMRSGILEWCENTTTLGLYLVGQKKDAGAHKKYRPQDYTPAKCQKLLHDSHKESSDAKYKILQNICKHFKPVFHNFFFEKFLNPGVWFEKRLAYTNSVATTSIVGYILGLGDRHVQNILIDEITAEVIHIDFGIAFEQGKVMPTPETVPFRLTRDIVAPFGICEVDGIFRKSCEKTMEVLRQNQTVLITTLEVLLYDPLYTWILKKHIKNKKIEVESDLNREEKNSTAQRALIRVRSKLTGMEEGCIGITSVEGQVHRLIKQAMDLRNISGMFHGWSPHL